MGEVNRQLSDAEASRIENEAYLRMIESGQADSVPAMRDDRVYQDLAIRQGDLRTQLAQVRAVYGDQNTNVTKLQDQLDEMTKEIGEERDRVTDGIRTAYSASQERERLMVQNGEKLRAQMVNVNSQLAGYNVLKSEAIANAELYNTLQARLKEAGIYAGLGSSNLRVIDLAENLDTPTGPHRSALIALGSLASIVVGFLACFVKESFNNTVRTPEDVRSWVGLRSLALLPVMNASDQKNGGMYPTSGRPLELAASHGPDSMDRSITLMQPWTAEAEAIRDLRTVLLASRTGGGASIVLISSAMEGEGKTTVAVNFAIALAQVGRTCLIDADLRRPTLSRALGFESTTGLSEVLTKKVPLSIALAPLADIPGLWFLPSGSAVESPADLIVSGGMQEMCDGLRKQFEFVVIDSPPVIRFSDARHLALIADDVVLIERYGITTRRAMQRSAELLNEVRAPLAGVVLNGIDYSSSDYHYFTYGYSRAAAKRSKSISPDLPIPPHESPDDPSPKSKGAHA
jgi:polysaccharide biosynthesis transport protein